VRVGVDTMLVAPVELGDSTYTGAGSVITEDVPEGSLGISRATQENVEGFAARKAAEAEEKRES
jgi:bifunctional UDP-N-acetylglucosamine pyrophosphorylase/glucosamine-1-phosphate N-acetyltransferase